MASSTMAREPPNERGSSINDADDESARINQNSEHNDDGKDVDSGAAGCYRGVQTCMGKCNIYCCLLCAPCGCGPLKTIHQGNVACVTEFGKFKRIMPPGTYAYNVCTEQYIPVTTKTICLDVNPQNVLTRDNLTLSIDAVVYFTIKDAKRATFQVENYRYSVNNLAQSTLRTVIGEKTLEELFANRKKVNARLTDLLDHETDKWGIFVSAVEMKDLVIPDNMQRTIAQTAEATREAEARIINAQGMHDASSILANAAEIMQSNPLSVQLQWFDTLKSISAGGSNNHRTIVVPTDVARMFNKN